MNGLASYLKDQIGAQLGERRVVVFYDPGSEYEPLFDRDLEQVGGAGEGLTNVLVGEELAVCARFSGSFFQLRAEIEPVVAADAPGHLIVYVPGVERDREGSVLAELESGGKCYEPQLKRQARTVLRQFYLDAAIDGMLAPATVTYDDIVGYLKQAGEGEQASVLKTIFGGASSDSLLVQWLASDAQDATVVDKEAIEELGQLIEARFGLEPSDGATISEVRARTTRYLLASEFRFDLDADAPESLSMVPEPSTKEQQTRALEAVDALRRQHDNQYAALADRVEGDLNLAAANLDPLRLGNIDTFRFEERALLGKAAELTAAGAYQRALEIVTERQGCFWLKDIQRQAQWEACRLAAELGQRTEEVASDLPRDSEAAQWVQAYGDSAGWCTVDTAERRLETWVARMDEEPEAEQAIAVVRQRHEELLRVMASGFSAALAASEWHVPGVLHQTEIYGQAVTGTRRPTAYFLVDAMRYEMGVELGEQLEAVEDLSIRTAVGAVPTITPVGMAALLPGAAESFSVGEAHGRLMATVAGKEMPNLAARLNYFKAEVPGLMEISLDDLLSLSSNKLSAQVDEASLVVVRSQEIDLGGESDNRGFARHVMDSSIGNIARAVRKLAKAGIESFAVTADHGHQFTLRKEEDMRTDSPGGDKVDLHRRAWAGRGGTTPPGTVRVAGTELGYDTDLDFIFPTGLGVFKAGGGLTYHHGGISLQELVIPLLTFRVPPAGRDGATTGHAVDLINVPAEVTNRVISVTVVLVGDVLTTEPVPLRVALVAGGEQVGEVGMALGADFDRASGVLSMTPGSEASVGLMLTREDFETVRIVVQDPATDAVMAQSAEMPVKLSI